MAPEVNFINKTGLLHKAGAVDSVSLSLGIPDSPVVYNGVLLATNIHKSSGDVYRDGVFKVV